MSRISHLALAAVFACAFGASTVSITASAAEAHRVAIHVDENDAARMNMALNNAQKALAADPDHAQAHTVIATIYQQLRQYDEAERHFRIALGLTPNDSYLLMAWGNFLCDRNDYAGAAAQYQQALSAALLALGQLEQRLFSTTLYRHQRQTINLWQCL